jgi:uncharacterized membrane protein
MANEGSSEQQDELPISEHAQRTNHPPQVQVASNTQNNFFVNLPADISLPEPEEFNKYPPEVRAFWLAAAAEEQKARHAWVFAEQKIRAEEWRGQRHNKLISMLLGLILAATLILTGTYLINQGHSLSGYFWALLGAAWLVSAAIFGFRPTQTPASELDSNSPTPPH